MFKQHPETAKLVILKQLELEFFLPPTMVGGNSENCLVLYKNQNCIYELIIYVLMPSFDSNGFHQKSTITEIVVHCITEIVIASRI